MNKKTIETKKEDDPLKELWATWEKVKARKEVISMSKTNKKLDAKRLARRNRYPMQHKGGKV